MSLKRERAPDSTTITCQIFVDRKEYIKARAFSCGKTASQYGAAIIDEWLRRGAPVLFKEDKLLPLPRFISRSYYGRSASEGSA
jgi:hypothetical protein